MNPAACKLVTGAYVSIYNASAITTQTGSLNLKILELSVIIFKFLTKSFRGPYQQVIRGLSFFFLIWFKNRYGMGNNV